MKEGEFLKKGEDLSMMDFRFFLSIFLTSSYNVFKINEVDVQ